MSTVILEAASIIVSYCLFASGTDPANHKGFAQCAAIRMPFMLDSLHTGLMARFQELANDALLVVQLLTARLDCYRAQMRFRDIACMTSLSG